MSDAYFEKILKATGTFLARWQDSHADMRELTDGHKTLTIVLYRVREQGNLVLSCIDPQFIRGPVRWSGSRVTVSRVVVPDGSDGFEVRDERADFAVLCGAVEVSENVKRYSHAL